jgi:hypothetical protein
MKRSTYVLGLVIAGAIALSASISLGQDAKKPDDKAKPAVKPDAKPGQDTKGGDAKGGVPGGMDEKAMWDMMEKLGTPGENHKLLENMVGDWTYTIKFTMSPGGEPKQATGTATTKSIMGGRYFVQEVKGTMPVPGPDGKEVNKPFEGISTTAYDNAKSKFVNSWIDNMSTGIMSSEGTYDAATKTFTYLGSMECMGMTSKTRTVIKIIDKDKHTLEMYESMNGQPETKGMEITYTRKGTAPAAGTAK